MILMLALTIISIPMISRPVHAFSCPLSPANNKIEGCVVNRDTGSPVSGLNVYIIDCGGFQFTVYSITDSNGHFSFQNTQANGSPCIVLNSLYVVSVNGITPVTKSACYLPNCNLLGHGADNPAWSQWAGDVSTDGNGYGSLVIQDAAAVTVNVPASALFSNTQFAAMAFSKTQGQTVSQTVGIQASIGGASNVQAGYQYSQSYTFAFSNGFNVDPNVQAWYGIPSYAIGYYCAGSSAEKLYNWTCSQGLLNAGVTVPTGAAYQISLTAENLDPNSLQVTGSSVTCPINVPAGTHQNFGTVLSGSASSTFSISSTLSLFGIGVTLSYSSSTSWQTEDATIVTINPTNRSLDFRFYPASGQCNSLILGPELHVWDMTGDFGVSASPSSMSIFQGSSASSTVNVKSTGGFSEGVSLSASAPPGIGVAFSPNPVSLASGGSANSTAYITVASAVAPGGYTVTIIGSSAVTSHSVSIFVTVLSITSGTTGGGGNKGCPCKT